MLAGICTRPVTTITSRERTAACARGNSSKVDRLVGNLRPPPARRERHDDRSNCRWPYHINDTAPDFEAQTTEGPINFHDWIGDSWAVLFSHPKDFTPVCTTELGYMASIKPEFDRRGVKIIGLSVDPIDRHDDWAKDIEETQGTAPNYPIIADSDFNVSKLYGMLPGGRRGRPAERAPRRTTRRSATCS